MLCGAWNALTVVICVLLLILGSSSASSSYNPPSPNLNRSLANLPNARPLRQERKFVSKLVEDEIVRVSEKIKDKALNRIWRNAYPNTLDTTVLWHDADGGKALDRAFPRSFLVTGDITASWLRDSTSQMNPYLHLLQNAPNPKDKRGVKEWDKLYRLALGLVYMQSQAVLTLPYANAFGPPKSAGIPYQPSRLMNTSNVDADWIYPPPPHHNSHWPPPPKADYSSHIANDGVPIWEVKWEVDSLANYFRLAARLAKESNRTDFVHNKTWKSAAQMALSALRAQQRGTEEERTSLAKSMDESNSSEPPTQSGKTYEDGGRVATDMAASKWKSHSSDFAMQDRKPAQPNYKRQTKGTVKKVLDGAAKKLQKTKPKQEGATKMGTAKTGSTTAEKTLSEWDRRFKPLGGGVYRFQRGAFRSASETKSEDGFGEPAKYTGMVKSAFRPSDDASILPFFVPGNAQLVAALADLATVMDSVPVEKLDGMARSIRDDSRTLSDEVRRAIEVNAVVSRKDLGGDVYVYETDGYGSTYFMDDANIPSLLSLPYLGFVGADDATYLRTRKMVLSKETNKYFFNGTVGWAIGGPHVGYGHGWPMSRSMQILTTSDKQEQLEALLFLRNTTTGTGLIHESINVDNPEDFSRPWFAWTNGLFGEAILHVLDTNPDLLTDHEYGYRPR